MSGPGRPARVSDFTGHGVPILVEGGKNMPEFLSAAMQLVGSLGFPIVMCILLYNHLEKEQQAHKEEIQSLRDCINDLKITLVSIRTVIGGNDNATRD